MHDACQGTLIIDQILFQGGSTRLTSLVSNEEKIVDYLLPVVPKSCHQQMRLKKDMRLKLTTDCIEEWGENLSLLMAEMYLERAFNDPIMKRSKRVKVRCVLTTLPA
jgi:hypothetical protein